jgi:hypothetical protein
MTQPDFRTLCAELADELDAETGYTKNDGERITHLAVARARAALATPPPEPPTDDELLRLYGVATPCYHVEEFKRELDFARAALERWGNYPAIPDSSIQAPPPEPPTAIEIMDLCGKCEDEVELVYFALKRWGHA